MDDKYLSTNDEPALGGGPFEPDPSEHRAAPVDRPAGEIETLRNSVNVEPALPQHHDPDAWNRWLRQKRQECSLGGNLGATVLAALFSGPFAVLGALMTGRPGIGGILYVTVFGPVVEELLKQSGMTYLLEKKPYRVFAAWQFLFAAAVSGLAFAAIENLVYIHVYARASGVRDVAAMAAFRWSVCTSLHLVCAVIASLGLLRVWKRQLHDGGPADLTAAFPWFTVAIVVHGLYNGFAILLEF